MNYSDQILENKAFDFFKQLMYNIALAICIMLVGVLVLVYGFKFKLYEVLSDSQAPIYYRGDMVVVKAQDKYEVGDIIKFKLSTGTDVTHRLIGILEENGVTYYIAHGDNVENVDGTVNTNSDYKDDVAYIQELKNQGKSKSEIATICGSVIQIVTTVEGKVVAHVDNYGTYFAFIKDHWGLFIALVAAIWCVSSVVQNEIDIKKARRLV